MLMEGQRKQEHRDVFHALEPYGVVHCLFNPDKKNWKASFLKPASC